MSMPGYVYISSFVVVVVLFCADNGLNSRKLN